jgi:peptide/nickel transport system substrate-binding protein
MTTTRTSTAYQSWTRLVLLAAMMIAAAIAIDPCPAVSASAPSTDKTLVVGTTKPIRGFTSMNDFQHRRLDDLWAGNFMNQLEDGSWEPALLESRISLDDKSWVLNSDGTSDAIYKIRKDITWHDGHPFTVQDIVFGFEVALDKDIPWENRTYARQAKLKVIDDYTLQITWNSWFGEADVITFRHIEPLPRHILENVYRTDKQRFINHPYWTTQYVGLGPYKVAELVPGDHLTLTAYDKYPKPAKIKNIIIRMLNSDVLVSEMLAGKVDVSTSGGPRDGGISLDDGMILAKQWAQSGRGKILIDSRRVVDIRFQMRDEWRDNKAIGDLRVRQALFDSVDRKALIDTLFNGQSEVPNTWVPTTSPVHKVFADHAILYPYDPKKAEQLFAEAGWKKGGGGLLRNAAGEPFKLEARATRGYTDVMTIVADYWKKAGVDVNLVVVPQARANDAEWMAKFPGVISHTFVNEAVGGGYHRFSCKRMPIEEEKYVQFPANIGSYCSKDMEEWYDKALNAFPFSESWLPYAMMQEISMRDLPNLPMFFEFEVMAVRSNVKGLNAIAPASMQGRSYSRPFMQAQLWDVQN